MLLTLKKTLQEENTYHGLSADNAVCQGFGIFFPDFFNQREKAALSNRNRM